MLTLLLVALWPLVASHCRMEQLPGFEFLACASEDSGETHQQGCETDSCASVESGLYKTEDGTHAVPTPPMCLSPFLGASLLDAVHSAGAESLALDVAPPHLRSSWQFAFRTALPPRAPSLVS